MTAFTFEAYLNHAGAKIFQSWSSLESLSPQSKLDLLSEKLSLNLRAGERPLQTIGELIRFRNALAHGKSHTLTPADSFHDVDEHLEKILRERPLTDWERLYTPDYAQRALADVEEIVRGIHEAAGFKDEHPFVLGVGTSSASIEG